MQSEEITMRKIVAGLFISLDGVVESPETWHFPYFNDEMGAAVGAQMAAADTMLLGRVTYQGFAEFWPNQGSDVEGADYMNSTPKLVASTTLDKVEWRNSTLIEGNVADALRKLKQEPGKNIGITGSVTLVRSLLRDGVLDELQLLVHPIVVGSGKRLFEDGGEQLPLTLVDSKTFSTGVVALTYRPADK
jgi:dihydrofolate reductase